MLDNVGIIHMNGRIYDPNLGRFLSVDPVFEFPTNTQSLNPYSYVLNNPLSMTDPTGYVAGSCGTGKTSCTVSIEVKTTAHELGSHIATYGNTTFTGTLDKNGNLHVSASGNGFGLGETAEVTVGSHGGGNGAQNSSQGPGTGQILGNSSNQGANTAPASSGNVAQANAATGSQTRTSQEEVDTDPVGKTTVGGLAKTLTNEVGVLHGGVPGELGKAKTALSNAIINNALLKHPAKVAPETGSASIQDLKIMRAAYLNRVEGGSDPVNGRTQYGTSHFILQSRSASNGLKGKAGRESVYLMFGPFEDQTSLLPTFIYIYNNPGN